MWAERAIRMAKVKQKISGGFRSKRGAERHAVLLSIIETPKKQGLNILETIQAALNQSLVFEGGALDSYVNRKSLNGLSVLGPILERCTDCLRNTQSKGVTLSLPWYPITKRALYICYFRYIFILEFLVYIVVYREIK